jgi:hypothetical protein
MRTVRRGGEKRAPPCRCGIERPLYKSTDDKIGRRVTFLLYTPGEKKGPSAEMLDASHRHC